MMLDPDVAPPPPAVMAGRENLRLTLLVLGSCLLILAFHLVMNRVTENAWIRQLATTLPAIGLQAVALWKGWHARVPVPGLPMPKAVFWLAPCLTVAANWLICPVTASAAATWLPVVLLYLLVGFGEELLFRGFLFALMRDVRPTICLLTTSIIFGAFHLGYGVQGIVFAGIVGLGFGLARLAGMPLALLMVLHGLTDIPIKLPHQKSAKIWKIDTQFFNLQTDTESLIEMIVCGYILVVGAIFIASQYAVWQRARAWMGQRLPRR